MTHILLSFHIRKCAYGSIFMCTLPYTHFLWQSPKPRYRWWGVFKFNENISSVTSSDCPAQSFHQIWDVSFWCCWLHAISSPTPSWWYTYILAGSAQILLPPVFPPHSRKRQSLLPLYSKYPSSVHPVFMCFSCSLDSRASWLQTGLLFFTRP